MKASNICYLSLFLLFTILFSCKSAQGLSKEEKIQLIDEKVQTQQYTFEARQANPAYGNTIHLTSSYTLTVRPDSVIAYLPYFGRAYSAPNPGDEGGIKFVSTDFDYSVSEKEKGVYKIAIGINDNPNNFDLSLLIGENGRGTLYVNQNNKQSISFYGDIE